MLGIVREQRRQAMAHAPKPRSRQPVTCSHRRERSAVGTACREVPGHAEACGFSSSAAVVLQAMKALLDKGSSVLRPRSWRMVAASRCATYRHPVPVRNRFRHR